MDTIHCWHISFEKHRTRCGYLISHFTCWSRAFSRHLALGFLGRQGLLGIHQALSKSSPLDRLNFHGQRVLSNCCSTTTSAPIQPKVVSSDQGLSTTAMALSSPGLVMWSFWTQLGTASLFVVCQHSSRHFRSSLSIRLERFKPILPFDELMPGSASSHEGFVPISKVAC
jgi:hypothetical protein